VSRNGPVTILDAQPSNTLTTVSFGDDRVMADVDMALPEEDVERIRQGYVCIRCLEPQSRPFPKICESKLPNGDLWCRFPIASEQLREFAQMFKGTVKIGPSVNLQDEIDRLNEVNEYEARTGIVLPDHIKFPTGRI
jgi:hypothetical protein